MTNRGDSEVTGGQLTGARLEMSRLHLDDGLDRVYARSTEIAARALAVARVGVWFFDFDRGLLVCKALYSDRNEELPLPLLLDELPAYVSAVREERFVATADARQDPATRELSDYLEAWGITSMLDAAVYRNGQVVGVVCAEHVGDPRTWQRSERQFAATVADLVSNFLEVHERRAAENETHALALKLKDAHRLDALGRMAAGIAHDLNNLLGVVTNGLAVLRVVPDPQVLEAMSSAAHHAATLVAQLMMIGRRQTPQAMVQPLGEVLSELERLVSASLPTTHHVLFDVEPQLEVWADRQQLQQVLVNLITNGVQAMPGAGTVVVRAHQRRQQGVDGVQFEVIDTGSGVKAEDLPKLFDPFFTTKDSGSGIGLAVVEQLVRHHRGSVSVSSTLGDGTTFTVWWPSKPSP